MRKAAVSPGAITKANSDLQTLANSIGRVVNGNKSTTGASAGQFVVLMSSTISGRADGLYTAAKAIPANTAIDSSYLTAAESGLNALNSKLIKHRTVSKSITCGNAIVHFPGSGTANLGLGQSDFISELPSGGTFVALIPSQATRADGIDVAFEIVPDNARTSIRIYGTPNATYTAYAELLYT